MPKIVQPTYIAKLPSTGKPIEFRPFSIREEKSLLLALQEDSIETLAATIKNIVSVCTDGKLSVATTPYYDVEYMFMQIRSKSIGEIVDLIGTCDCEPNKTTEFSVDIADVTVEPKPTGNAKIKILDTDYSIELQHPSIDDFVTTFKSGGADAANVVANCIVHVYTEDEVMNWSEAETLDFVESMTTRQQKEISEYLSDMPMVKLPTPFKCRHCGKEHNNKMSGFENFFV